MSTPWVFCAWPTPSGGTGTWPTPEKAVMTQTEYQTEHSGHPEGSDRADALLCAEGVEPVGNGTVFEQLTAETGGVLGSMTELTDYLDRVVRAVRTHVSGCDEVAITVLVGDRPHTAAYTTVRTLQVDAEQYALDEGPCLEAARTGREVIAGMGEADARWPDFTAEARDDGVRSLMALPMTSGGKRVGALNLFAWQPAAFDALDVSLARVAASRAADAVVAVTSLDGATRLAGQLEQAMVSRAVIEQAKGVLMAMRGIDEQTAFDVLRKQSQDRNVKLRVIAEQVVAGVVRERGTG